MAHVANAHNDGGLGGTRLDDVATGATNLRVHVFRMNICFHKRPRKIAGAGGMTSGKFGQFASILRSSRKDLANDSFLPNLIIIALPAPVWCLNAPTE